jgi:hypothetical protein
MHEWQGTSWFAIASTAPTGLGGGNLEIGISLSSLGSTKRVAVTGLVINTAAGIQSNVFIIPPNGNTEAQNTPVFTLNSFYAWNLIDGFSFFFFSSPFLFLSSQKLSTYF